MAEAAVGDAQGATKKPGKLGGLLARRKKKLVDETAAAAVPAGYRTFSNKLAPSLIALGGLLSLAGALGAWIRTSQVATEGLQEEQVRAVMGHESDWGRVIALVAGVATVSAFVWLRRNLVLKIVSILAALAVIGLAAWRLPIINDAAAGLAFQARTGEIDFISFHAGFGWGAWCLIVGAVALFLGISVGILRELDLRKGVEG